MRILHIVPTFYPAVRYGGPIYSVLQLCLALNKLGCQVKVLTTDADGNSRLTAAQQIEGRRESLDVRYCHRIGRGMVAPALLPNIIKEAAWADVIHLTAIYNFPTFPTLITARLRGTPLVWSPRGTLQRWKGSRRTAFKTLWEKACRQVVPRGTALHVTSEDEARESNGRVGNAAIAVIPNGIEIPPPPPPPARNGTLKLLFLGRLDPKKGVENLLSSVSLISQGGDLGWRLTIVGDGPSTYVERLKALAVHSGIAAQVDFRGHLTGDSKSSAIAESDVVVVPSHTENFGMVVAEALAHARPVIASQGTPWHEMEGRRCGRWVPNDPVSLAAAIREMDRSDRISMGQRGRDWMIRDFTWCQIARHMLSLYESLS